MKKKLLIAAISLVIISIVFISGKMWLDFSNESNKGDFKTLRFGDTREETAAKIDALVKAGEVRECPDEGTYFQMDFGDIEMYVSTRFNENRLERFYFNNGDNIRESDAARQFNILLEILTEAYGSPDVSEREPSGYLVVTNEYATWKLKRKHVKLWRWYGNKVWLSIIEREAAEKQEKEEELEKAKLINDL